MTKLWIVCYGWDYEGGHVAGIYDNITDAKRLLGKLRSINVKENFPSRGDWQFMKEIRLNKEYDDEISI